VCKPVQDKERRFYQQLSGRFPALLPFVPSYYGTMEGRMQSEQVPRSRCTRSPTSSPTAAHQAEQQLAPAPASESKVNPFGYKVMEQKKEAMTAAVHSECHRATRQLAAAAGRTGHR
jgi:hypothetical protein